MCEGACLSLRPLDAAEDLVGRSRGKSNVIRGLRASHAGIGGSHLLQEAQELQIPVPGIAGVGDPPRGRIEGGEQTGDAVPGVVAGPPLGDA